MGIEFGTSFNLSGVIEYHYNGFGAGDPEGYLTLAREQGSRLSRGQIAGLGQHYAGAFLGYQPHPLVNLGLVYIQNLTDGSLILGPTVDYSISDEVRLSFSGFIPMGREATWETGELFPALTPRSEYGMSPQIYFVQLRAAI